MNKKSLPSDSPLNGYQPKIYKPTLGQYKIKQMVYGPPGVGKTTYLATADLHPLTAPIININIEGGMLSIAEAETIGLTDVPDVIDLENFEHLDKLFWWLAKGDHPYKSVGLDSFSELQMFNLDDIVSKQINKVSASGAKREDMDDIWQDDYGKSTQQLRRVARRFRDLPMHVFFSCHDAESKDKDGMVKVHPLLTPKLRTSVIGYLDIVSYMYMQTVKVADEDGEEQEQLIRRLLCQPYGKWTAKDRSPGGKLGVIVDDPSIPKVMNLITGNTKGEDE